MRRSIIYLFACVFLLASCNDWLDVKPRKQSEEKDQFSSTKGFQDALIACYIKMNNRSIYGEQMTMRTLEFMAQHWSYNINNTTDIRSLKAFDYTTSYSETIFKNMYADLYNVVAQANAVLQNLEKSGKDVISDSRMRAIIEAEALGIRAFIHIDVLRLFGQVPWSNSTIKISLPYAETVSYKEAISYYDFAGFYGKILDDLTRAENLLKDHDPLMDKNDGGAYTSLSVADTNEDFYSYRRFRVNYYSVLAMKARLYMYVGKPADAAVYANSVITALTTREQMELAGDSDFNNEYFALPSECILALSNSELSYANNIMSPRDELWQETKDIEDRIFGARVEPASNNRVVSNLWNMNAIDAGGSVKPVINKYRQPTGSDRPGIMVMSTMIEIIPLLRLSEMYLIAMEAASFTDANELYKTYMRARNVTNPTLFTSEDDKMAEILNEYRREFFAEGQMFFTYKRRGADRMMFKDEVILEENYVVPLPNTESAGK